MYQYLTVRVEYLRFGNETEVLALFIHYRQIPCFRIVESTHHLLHAVRIIKTRRSGSHQFTHRKTMIQFLAEHDIAYIVQQDNTD